MSPQAASARVASVRHAGGWLVLYRLPFGGVYLVQRFTPDRMWVDDRTYPTVGDAWAVVGREAGVCP